VVVSPLLIVVNDQTRANHPGTSLQRRVAWALSTATPGNACQTSHWEQGHRRECKKLAAQALEKVMGPGYLVLDSADASSVQASDQAIHLTWTLRGRFPAHHLGFLEGRGRFEIDNSAPGEPGRRRVSDTMSRSLRGLSWRPGTAGEDDPCYKPFFRATITLYHLGVHQHQALALELLRTRFHDMEDRVTDRAWVARSLAEWIIILFEGVLVRPCAGGEREALLGEAKEVAARALPLLGQPWGEHATTQTHKVRLEHPTFDVRGPAPSLVPSRPIVHR
jgi:hypothetical protein